MNHKLTIVYGPRGGIVRYECSICKWSWAKDPTKQGMHTQWCPGVPRYNYNTRPENHLSKTELKKLKLLPGGKVVSVIFMPSAKKFVHLYDRDQAVPIGKKAQS